MTRCCGHAPNNRNTLTGMTLPPRQAVCTYNMASAWYALAIVEAWRCGGDLTRTAVEAAVDVQGAVQASERCRRQG